MGTIPLTGRGTRVCISPRDNHVVTVSGDRIFKMLRVQENSFKYLGDVTNVQYSFLMILINILQSLILIKDLLNILGLMNTNYYVRFLIENRIGLTFNLVANDQATIYIILGSQVVQVLNNCFNLSENDPQASVSSIAAFTRGFVIGI